MPALPHADPGARAPCASSSSCCVEDPTAATSLGPDVLAGAGLASGVSTASEVEELEEGEIPAAGVLGGGGRSAGSLISDAPPRRDAGPGGSPSSVRETGASKENRASIVQTSCSTLGRTAPETYKENADPGLGEQSEDGLEESADGNDDPREDGKGGMDKETGQEDKTPEHTNKKQKKDEKEGGAGSHPRGFDGEDTAMLVAAVLPPTEAAKKPLSSILKDFPMLHKVALTPMCTHQRARPREDLKLQKKGSPIVAESPPGGNKVVAAGSVDTDGCNTTSAKILEAQSVSGKLGTVRPAAPVVARLDSNEVLGSTRPVASTVCMGQEVDMKEKEGQAVEDVRKEAGKLYSNEVLGSTLPMASTVCMRQDVYKKEKEGLGVEAARKEAGKLYAESKQEKMPTLMEKNLRSSGTDEHSTWKAMKRASRRNLDGELR